MIQPGTGYTSTNVGGAVTLNIDPTWLVWGEASKPFEVSTFLDSGNYYAKVAPGTVNNIEPTMGGTPLSNNPAPSIFVGYSASPSIYYVYLTLPVGGSGTPPPYPDSPTVNVGSSVPTSDNSNAYLALASVDISNGVVNQYVSGSQWAERYKCGSADAAYFFGLV